MHKYPCELYHQTAIWRVHSCERDIKDMYILATRNIITHVLLLS